MQLHTLCHRPIDVRCGEFSSRLSDILPTHSIPKHNDDVWLPGHSHGRSELSNEKQTQEKAGNIYHQPVFSIITPDQRL